ncbi:MAG: hypothetical protein WA880_13945 [Ornithinimicrobium sp.]
MDNVVTATAIDVPSDWSLEPAPVDDQPLGPPWADLEGSVDFMPFAWLTKATIDANATAAFIDPSGLDRRIYLPLAEMTISSARPLKRFGNRKCFDARWELSMTLRGQPFTFTGSWATLAWLGYLGGWPEPQATMGTKAR